LAIVAYVINTFYGCNLLMSLIKYVCSWQALPAWSNGRSLPWWNSFQGLPSKFKLLVLPTNIRQGWKCLKGTNTLAYYEHSQSLKHWARQKGLAVDKHYGFFCPRLKKEREKMYKTGTSMLPKIPMRKMEQ